MTQSFFICPDCEQPNATASGSLCASCAQWRAAKFSEIDDEYQLQRERTARRRMSPNERFAEALADLAKAGERSRR